MSDKLDLESKDLIAQKLEQLEQLFPNLVTEGENGKVLDLDQLKNEFSTEVVEGTKERYRLEWPGKKEAIVTANLPTSKTLRPVKEDSVDFDNTENLYIEGDNLEVLKILQESYFGKIKMIYIDPPYNTGEDFVYRDNFTKSIDDELAEGGQRDEYSQRLFQNVDTSGRYHSDWLSMIHPRLKLARNLLTSDGAIFISIDDNEVSNLKKVCDEIFGEENFINQISLNAKVSAGASGGGEDRKLKKNIEYILIYSKRKDEWKPIKPVYKSTKLMDYIDQMKKDGKSFKYTNILYKADSETFHKTIKDGSGDDITIYKVEDYEITTVNKLSKEKGIPVEEVYKRYFDKIMTTTNAQTSIRDRVWAATDSEQTMYRAEYTPKSGKNKGKITSLYFTGKQKVLMIWLKDTAVKIGDDICKREKIGTYWDGFSWINVSKEGAIKYPNGKKPISLISQLIDITADLENSIILDFFAGSASTAHAVLQNNLDNNRNNKFISVQLPEKISAGTKDNKEYLKYLEDINVPPFVTEVGKYRLKNAGKKIKEETGSDIDYGFRVYRLDESNMADVYHRPQDYDQNNLELFADNVKEGRSADDLLAQIMLDWGLPLSLPIEETTIAGKRVFNVAGNSLMACFETGIDEAFAKKVAEEEPLRIVFKDAGFASDTAKSNVKQLLKQLSPETEMKVI